MKHQFEEDGTAFHERLKKDNISISIQTHAGFDATSVFERPNSMPLALARD